MTLREAVIQAHLELGLSRETAELQAKLSDALVPDAAAPAAQYPVRSGLERPFIEALKRLFRQMDAHPKAVQDALRAAMVKRTSRN